MRVRKCANPGVQISTFHIHITKTVTFSASLLLAIRWYLFKDGFSKAHQLHELHQHFKLFYNSWKDIEIIILTVKFMPGAITARAIITGGIFYLGELYIAGAIVAGAIVARVIAIWGAIVVGAIVTL